MATNRKSPKAWTVRDAKAHFSEVFERALETPQRVVRAPRGRTKPREIVMMSMEAYEKLAKPRLPLGDFMASLAFDKFEPSREESFERDIELGP
jgi:hypothetical protein